MHGAPGGQPDADRRCRFRRTIRRCRSPYWLGVTAAHMLDLSEFKTSKLPTRPSELAPDGSAVRPLLGLPGGSMAHFELPAAETSRAVAHRTVGELWFVLSGRGELWRKRGTREEVVVLEPGDASRCLKVPTFSFAPHPARPSRLSRPPSRGGPAVARPSLWMVRGHRRRRSDHLRWCLTKRSTESAGSSWRPLSPF